jgi:hypothetical protein
MPISFQKGKPCEKLYNAPGLNLIPIRAFLALTGAMIDLSIEAVCVN